MSEYYTFVELSNVDILFIQLYVHSFIFYFCKDFFLNPGSAVWPYEFSSVRLPVRQAVCNTVFC